MQPYGRETIASRSRPLEELSSLAPEGSAELQRLFKSLNEVLTAELICAIRRRDRRRTALKFVSAHKPADIGFRLQAEFYLADRIGGHPEFALEALNQSAPEESNNLAPKAETMFRDLSAERTAASLHRRLLMRLGDSDPETSRLLCELLVADEAQLVLLSKPR
jgi:hypothetical protein